MAATSEGEMCNVRLCFREKAPSLFPLIKGTVAEPHKQLFACMSPHLSECLRVFRSLFCHLRYLIYYLCPRLLEIPRCLNSSLPRAHPCTSARPRLRVGIMATDSTVGSGDDGTDSDGKTAQMIATNSSSASASTAQTRIFNSDFGRMPQAEKAVSEICREWRMSLSNKSFSRNVIFLIFVNQEHDRDQALPTRFVSSPKPTA